MKRAVAHVASAIAQAAVSRNCLHAVLPTFLMMYPHAGGAQEAGGDRAWVFEPTVSVGLTATDNYALQPAKESDLITEIRPGIRINGKSRRVRGYLDYSLNAVAYSRHSTDNEVLHALGAEATAELVESLAFLDASASIAQQSTSVAGTQSLDPARRTPNRTEIARLKLSPYIAGPIGTFAEYDVRASQEEIRADREDVSDVSERRASAQLRGGRAAVEWLVEASYEATDFSLGRSTEGNWVRAGLGTQIGGEFRVRANAGRESNNILTIERQSYGTWGVQAQWLPTERTDLTATYDKRYFGNPYSVSLAHRTRQTVWSFVSYRAASSDVVGGTAASESVYGLYYRQFESKEPDPIKRDALVRGFLQANGIDPTLPAVSGFLSSAVTEERGEAFSVGLIGVRNSVTLRLEHTRTRRLDPVVVVDDDLAGQGETRLRGVIVEAAHRLTPLSSISATGVYRDYRQDDTGLDSNLKSISAAWTGRGGANSDIRLGARYTVHNSTTFVNSYNEGAIFVTYLLRL